jgi:hypothetical protein
VSSGKPGVQNVGFGNSGYVQHRALLGGNSGVLKMSYGNVDAYNGAVQNAGFFIAGIKTSGLLYSGIGSSGLFVSGNGISRILKESSDAFRRYLLHLRTANNGGGAAAFLDRRLDSCLVTGRLVQ